MWFLIEVDIAGDIGTQETERVYINNVDIETKEIDEDPDKFSAKVYGRYVHPATIELNQFNAPKETEKEDPFSLISKFKRHLLVEFGNACRKYYGSQMDPYYGGQVEIIAKQMKILSIDDTTIHWIMDEEKELSQKINGSTSMFVAGEEIKPGTTVEQKENDKTYQVKPLTKNETTEDKENNTPTDDCKNTINKMYTLIHHLEDKYHESVEAFEERIGDLNKKFETGSEYDKLVHSGLSKEIAELEQAFESECDHYDNEINALKHAMCKQTELPRGEEMTAAEHIEPYQFVYMDSNGKARECKEGVPPSGGSAQANDPKIMTIEEAEKQRNELLHKNNELVLTPLWNLGTHLDIAKNINKIYELEEWIENQKNVRTDPLPPKEPDLYYQIKTGENRLKEIKWSIISKTEEEFTMINKEFDSLSEHISKLVEQYTKIKPTYINVEPYRVVYSDNQKGLKIEFT